MNDKNTKAQVIVDAALMDHLISNLHYVEHDFKRIHVSKQLGIQTPKRDQRLITNYRAALNACLRLIRTRIDEEIGGNSDD